MIERIEWLGHASFRIQGPPCIYIDPWRVSRPINPPDVILITHEHYDHCSPADIDKLRGPNTLVVTNNAAAQIIPGAVVLRPWQVYNVGRVSIKAVPAYNKLHPATAEGLGFIISLDLHDVYFAGDCGLMPEMNRLRPDIAVLPIGGDHTMGVTEALEAVRILRPRHVLPSHWGSPSEGGTILDMKAFTKGACGLSEVVVPARTN